MYTKGNSAVSDQPARGVETDRGRENDDSPTRFGDSRESAGPASSTRTHRRGESDAESAATYSELRTPRYDTPVPSDGAAAAVAALRSEQRSSDETAVMRFESAEWDAATPPTGLPAIHPVTQPDPYYPPVPPVAPPPGAPLAPLYRPTVSPTRYPDLATTSLLRQAKPAPASGWRRLLYTISGGAINFGESSKDVHRKNLIDHVNQPLSGCYRIALLSLKGGVGKTTITASLGSTFASIRGDRVIAVDANPDRGTLSQKVPLETPATVRHLVRDADSIDRYSDVRSYTSQGPSRLEVVASESDPAVSEAFSSDDYIRVLEVLERFYNLVLTDCGTGLMHSAMSGVLANADTLIVVSSGSVDGARSASATLDWLEAHGYEELVRNSVAVVNAVRPRSGKVDMQKVVDHFSRRCRAVRLVPFDPHLEEGAEVSLDRLRRETREALIELAAVVADGFPRNGSPT